MTLPPRGWAPENHQALTRFLDEMRAREGRKIAVFDWDNTCVFRDAGEAVLLAQLGRVDFPHDAAAFSALLDETTLSPDDVVGGVPFGALRAELEADYARLFEFRGGGLPEDEDTSLTHARFCTNLLALYVDLEELVGARLAYGWLVGWLAGFDVDALSALVTRAIDAAQAGPIGTQRFAHPARDAAYDLERGLRAQPEIQDLFVALTAAGVEVCVVSASHEGVVEHAALALGYVVAPERIIGMRLCESGRPRVADDDVHPVTYGDGKVAAIRKYLQTEPVLVAGDTHTDHAMLSAFPDALKLVINRNEPEGKLAALYRAALAGDPKVLLQGRDENAGGFRPSRFTVAHGDDDETTL